MPVPGRLRLVEKIRQPVAYRVKLLGGRPVRASHVPDALTRGAVPLPHCRTLRLRYSVPGRDAEGVDFGRAYGLFAALFLRGPDGAYLLPGPVPHGLNPPLLRGLGE